ncbi:BppU family phage baseplate upper protein [Lachnoclostridium sp.]|uniref:BppU family phage baseplate upper protein n=1 Tax=Lachnoclostridium sp. TaxID=2028282 RepID=UPI0028A1ED9F|nr:BppU family phage baseplate upper protein [Lachnoclostridium sp.]
MTNDIIKLDVHKSYGYQIITAKQYDANSRSVTIELFDNDNIRNIDSNETIKIRCTKPDDTWIINNANSTKGNKATFILTKEMLSAAGTIAADIGIYKNVGTNNPEDDELISTFLFFIHVEESGYDENKVMSSNETLSLLELIAEQRILNKKTVELNTRSQELIIQMEQLLSLRKMMDKKYD